MEPYFVNICTPYEVLSSAGFVKNTFDLTLNLDKTKHIFNENYKHYKTLGTTKKPITISPTKAASLFTIPAINEEYMCRSKNEYLPGDHPKYSSSLNILYISSTPDTDVNIKKSDNTHNNESEESYSNKELSSCVVSNAIGTIPSITQHNLLLDIKQFVYFGIREDLLTEKLKSELDTYYTYDNIKGDKLKKSLHFLKNKFSDDPVHIVFDLGILSSGISPLSVRENYTINNNGINLDELMLMLEQLKTLNIVGLDIVNYFLVKDTVSIMNRIQAETIQRIYGNLLGLKMKSFNVFNEHSKFLIFKPVEEISKDIGWYIMRGIDDLKVREEIMKKIELDQIITVKIPNEDTDKEDTDKEDTDKEDTDKEDTDKEDTDKEEKEIFITTTTIYDQNEFSYFSSEDFLDKRLYPEEKMDMMFELVNV
jgi:hypothetical protein